MKKMSEDKSALIIGASRGLGLAIARELLERGWNVAATVRSGKTGLHKLAETFPESLEIEYLDITDADQIAGLKSRLQGKDFDLLFVNAGVANKNGMSETIGEIAAEEFVRVMTTNALWPMKVLEAFSGMVRSGGVIGAMSSGQGSVADNERGGNDVYRASKAALNMLMRSFAARHPRHALLLLAPGWVKTDMGGSKAVFSLEDVIPDIVNTMVSRQGENGLSYLDRFGKPIRW